MQHANHGYKAQVFTPDRVHMLVTPIHSQTYWRNIQAAVTSVVDLMHERTGTLIWPRGTVMHIFKGEHGNDRVIQTRVYWSGWVIMTSPAEGTP